ncbi:S8 family serine peptidase [Muriicola sp.]|uniref:S8 family serine peptidase n=1 Tax=Muriicola sp. TaxID=2020856 RepID=UPI003C7129CC
MPTFKYFSIYLFSLSVFWPMLTFGQGTNDSIDLVNRFWHQKDLEIDSIPGTGLDRVHNELLKDKKGVEVVVAVLDTKVDIFHEDLEGRIWINKDEIPGNGIDDDENGYIDDINGWNFLGNKEGEDILYQQPEYVRFVRRYNKEFSGKTIIDIPEEQIDVFRKYYEAKKKLETEYEEAIVKKSSFDSIYDLYQESKLLISKHLNDSLITTEKLKNLESINPSLKKYTSFFINFILEYGIEDSDMQWNKLYFQNRVIRDLNIEYNDRALLHENERDILDKDYGNPIVYGEANIEHSIGVCGILAATRDNGLGIDGFSNNIKIMPIVMVSEGDEHDKDVALAIRYAVDNGAHIINMSWGKYLSLNEHWVIEAIKYAWENDVLIVSSAGNDSKNIDNDTYYPTDYFEGEEYVNTFILVGGTTRYFDEHLVATFSNFGKRDVDIFAPADEIYTTNTSNSYKVSKGTSYSSPIVAGTAALIKSYYPEFSSLEIKTIILDAGTPVNFEIELNLEGNSTKMVPFSEVCKTGKIINTYNALLFADALHVKNGKTDR